MLSAFETMMVLGRSKELDVLIESLENDKNSSEKELNEMTEILPAINAYITKGVAFPIPLQYLEKDKCLEAAKADLKSFNEKSEKRKQYLIDKIKRHGERVVIIKRIKNEFIKKNEINVSPEEEADFRHLLTQVPANSKRMRPSLVLLINSIKKKDAKPAKPPATEKTPLLGSYDSVFESGDKEKITASKV